MHLFTALRPVRPQALSQPSVYSSDSSLDAILQLFAVPAVLTHLTSHGQLGIMAIQWVKQQLGESKPMAKQRLVRRYMAVNTF